MEERAKRYYISVVLKRLSCCFGGSFNEHEPAFWSDPLLAHFEWKESANSVNFSSNEVKLGQNAQNIIIYNILAQIQKILNRLEDTDTFITQYAINQI